jgi:hypothetical protein
VTYIFKKDATGGACVYQAKRALQAQDRSWGLRVVRQRLYRLPSDPPLRGRGVAWCVCACCMWWCVRGWVGGFEIYVPLIYTTPSSPPFCPLPP